MSPTLMNNVRLLGADVDFVTVFVWSEYIHLGKYLLRTKNNKL